ncbi:MAG: hypothetical protein ACLRRT_14335 [Ruthenibacterium lactatiformans]
MIAGTMGTVVLFIESRMPALMADIIMEKVPNINGRWWRFPVCGLISAFVDNVATVLMVAPVALALAKKLTSALCRSSSPLRCPPICRARPRWWEILHPFCWAAMPA